MKTKHLALLLAILATGISSIASSDSPEGITITAKALPTVKSKENHVIEISLSYVVSASDLDLATDSGAQALEQRMHNAADAVCKEIGRQYPNSWPSDKACAKAAVDRAMPKALELIDSAKKAASQKSSS